MRHFSKILILITILVGSVTVIYGQGDGKQKGVLLYKLVSNIEWPPGTEKFTIGIFGESDIQPVLKAISQARKLHDKVIFVKGVSSTKQIDDCQILYVPKSSASKIELLSKFISGKNILLITESSGSVVKGSGLNFLRVNNQIVFEVGKNNISQQGLLASDKIYPLAFKVY